eukprot:scaffold8501_cov129-Isochrysis_galbana.AAC.4
MAVVSGKHCLPRVMSWHLTNRVACGSVRVCVCVCVRACVYVCAGSLLGPLALAESADHRIVAVAASLVRWLSHWHWLSCSPRELAGLGDPRISRVFGWRERCRVGVRGRHDLLDDASRAGPSLCRGGSGLVACLRALLQRSHAARERVWPAHPAAPCAVCSGIADPGGWIFDRAGPGGQGLSGGECSSGGCIRLAHISWCRCRIGWHRGCGCGARVGRWSAQGDCSGQPCLPPDAPAVPHAADRAGHHVQRLAVTYHVLPLAEAARRRRGVHRDDWVHSAVRFRGWPARPGGALHPFCVRAVAARVGVGQVWPLWSAEPAPLGRGVLPAARDGSAREGAVRAGRRDGSRAHAADAESGAGGREGGRRNRRVRPGRGVSPKPNEK